MSPDDLIVPNISDLDGPNDDVSSQFDDDDLLGEHNNDMHLKESDAEIPVSGIVQTYLLELKECLSREIALPQCYQHGHFWIRPKEPYFLMHDALSSSDGLTPYSLYQPTVFLWLPQLLIDDNTVITCDNPDCQHYNRKTKP